MENSQNKNDIDYGSEANLQDAKISGYTDKNGRAKQMSKSDVEGSPTGALTDVGAGRSSVVKSNDTKKTLESQAPTLGEEQAP